MQLMTGKEKQVWIEMLGTQFSPHWKDVQLYRGHISKDKEKKCSLLFQNCALSIPKESESIAALGLLWLGFPEVTSIPFCQADCVGKKRMRDTCLPRSRKLCIILSKEVLDQYIFEHFALFCWNRVFLI